MEHLRQGYGVSVCNIIDELLNIELYRREFQFLAPVIPDDDPSDAEDDYETNPEGTYGSPDRVI